MSNTTKTRGFTLIEISIVLIIIGLVVAGILVGRDLIKDAENKRVIRSLESFRTAFYAFRTKYNALPGDMRSPSIFWANITTEGNGNGLINVWPTEASLAWQELLEAGLVNVSVTAPDQHYAYGVTPSSNGVAYWYNKDLHIPSHISRYGNTISLTTAGSVGTDAGSIMSSEDAYLIDSKMDDGMPESGRLYGMGDITGGLIALDGCVTSMDPPPVVYYLSNPYKACRLVYYID